MEFTLTALLSREDILKIFYQRQLDIRNVDALTQDELLRVYKTFVMPLSRRPERSKKIKVNYCKECNNKHDENEEQDMKVDLGSCCAMDIDSDCTDTSNVSLNDRMPSPVGEKRRQRCIDVDISDKYENDYQYQLASFTKRIRINSLS